MPQETISLKCACGYIKHDIIHLGVWKNRATGLLSYCGGLLELCVTEEGVRCKKCTAELKAVEFRCSFCENNSLVNMNYKEALASGRATIIQMSVHKTVVFSE